MHQKQIELFALSLPTGRRNRIDMKKASFKKMMLLITNQPNFITKDYVISLLVTKLRAKHYFIYI